MQAGGLKTGEKVTLKAYKTFHGSAIVALLRGFVTDFYHLLKKVTAARKNSIE